MAFLQSEQGSAFKLDKITGMATGEEKAVVVSADGMLEVYPHKHEVDGAFAARMLRRRRTEDADD